MDHFSLNIPLGRRTVVAGALTCLARPIWAARGERHDEDVPPAGFSGTVLLAARGRAYAVRHYGRADIARSLPVAPDTRFAFGSASKWLTTVAVLKLAEARRLDLDAPLSAYLPELPRTTGDRVRLHHLLSNTSGIPDLLSRAVQQEPGLRTSAAGAAAMAARFGGGDLLFEPGTAFDYQVLNWVLVNAVVTRVTAMPFAAAMRDLVFRPLDLPTLALASDGWEAVPNMAQAYRSLVPPVTKMTGVPAFAAASGNMAGTAHDAMRAAHGVFATNFLRPASRAALIAVRWPAQEYALGGRVHAIGEERWAWETGKVEGYRALIAHHLGQDETVVVFNNSDLDQGVLAAWAEELIRSRRRAARRR